MNLGKTQPPEPPRIFISYAWEDKTLVRRLEAALKDARAVVLEIWEDDGSSGLIDFNGTFLNFE
jgi:hypothetical protein